MDSNKNKKIKSKISDAAGEAAGTLISTGIGMVLGGPAGAVAGAVVGSVLSNVSSEVLSRHLSRKEKERIESVVEVTKNKIEQNYKDGKKLRTDDFFDNIDGVSAGEEIYEGVLIAAQREYEEKKVELLGRMYANLAFDNTITRPIACSLIKSAINLTYQQLIIIKVIGHLQIIASNGTDVRKNKAYTEVRGNTNVSIASDILVLYNNGLVHSSEAILDAAGINPSKLVLVGNGANLFNLMELSKTKIDDIEINVMKFLSDQ